MEWCQVLGSFIESVFRSFENKKEKRKKGILIDISSFSGISESNSEWFKKIKMNYL